MDNQDENAGDDRAKHSSDTATPARDDTGRFRPGHVKLGGRRRGQTVSAELRRQADPEAIARKLLAMIDDPTVGSREKLGALSIVLDRLEGRAISRSLNLSGEVSSDAVQTLLQMAPADRLQWLDSERARRALPGGEDE